MRFLSYFDIVVEIENNEFCACRHTFQKNKKKVNEMKKSGLIEVLKKEKISRVVVVLFFALVMLYGALTYDDYGISSDEPIQRHHSIVMYNDLFLKDETYQTLTINTEELPTLKEYGVPYGVILQLPLVWVEHMNDFEMTHLEIYEMRHLYNFLWFFVSVIFFYRRAFKTRFFEHCIYFFAESAFREGDI